MLYEKVDITITESLSNNKLKELVQSVHEDDKTNISENEIRKKLQRSKQRFSEKSLATIRKIADYIKLSKFW